MLHARKKSQKQSLDSKTSLGAAKYVETESLLLQEMTVV
jgi:hypothetical protein